MEITTVRYRRMITGEREIFEEHTGLYSVVEGGVVLIHSEASQTFIPYSKIESIRQTINLDDNISEGVRMEKSLISRHRRRN